MISFVIILLVFSPQRSSFETYRQAEKTRNPYSTELPLAWHNPSVRKSNSENPRKANLEKSGGAKPWI